MEKRILFLLLPLLFISSVVYAVPQFKVPVNSTANGTQYSPTLVYNFQINITNNTDGEWTSITNGTAFQLGMANGSVINFTSKVYNNTVGNFWINFTQNSLGKAGNYNYTWFANDTDDLWNKSSTYLFTIAANTSAAKYMNLSIDTNQANVTYDPTGPRTTNATAWFSGAFNDTYINATMWRDTTYKGEVSTTRVQDVQNLAYGTYDYVFNTSGNTNYSSTSITWTLRMNPYSSSGGGGAGGGSSGVVVPLPIPVTPKPVVAPLSAVGGQPSVGISEFLNAKILGFPLWLIVVIAVIWAVFKKK